MSHFFALRLHFIFLRDIITHNILCTLRCDDILDLAHDLAKRLGLVVALVIQSVVLKPLVPQDIIAGLVMFDQFIQARAVTTEQLSGI